MFNRKSKYTRLQDFIKAENKLFFEQLHSVYPSRDEEIGPYNYYQFMKSHSIKSYSNLVSNLLDSLPEDEAMKRAIGAISDSEFISSGDLQVQVLKVFGLKNHMTIYDLGCGSGRTAFALERLGWEGIYFGHDIEPRLVAYLNKNSQKYKACVNEELAILAGNNSVDIIFHWSVFTHLLLEEVYIYMKDIFRALKPGGLHIFSFLDLNEEKHFNDVFLSRIEAFTQKYGLEHNDLFLSKEQIKVMATKIGFNEINFESGEDGSIHSPFWQSLAIMKK